MEIAFRDYRLFPPHTKATGQKFILNKASILNYIKILQTYILVY